MGLYDGTVFIPINFSFHREKGSNKKLKYGLKLKYLKKTLKYPDITTFFLIVKKQNNVVLKCNLISEQILR